jgi:hypothetical protein
MAKAKKCTLIFHGLTREVNMGTFPSISKARSYAHSIILDTISLSVNGAKFL